MDIKEIFERRSIRKFQNEQVEQEKIEKLLRAAMQAPTAGNQQPWEFIVVQDKKLLSALSETSPYSKLVADAPLAIVLLGNQKRVHFHDYWEQDMAACAENLLLEATSLGLGAVWLGVSPIEERVAHIKNVFHLPDEIVPFCIIPVGYPADDQKNIFIDRFDKNRIKYNKY